jgi:hypothetical protein
MQMRRASAAYSALLPLPVPAVLGERILESLGAAAGAGAAGASATPFTIIKAIGLNAAKAKFATVALVATTATAAASVATVATPIEDEIVPGAATVQQPAQQTEVAAPPLSGVDDMNAGRSSATATPLPVGLEQGISAPLDPNLVPGTLEAVDGLTGTVTSTLDQTTGEVGQTVDSLIHEVNAVTGALPTAPPVDTSVVPPLPVGGPLPAVPVLPTVPALPTVPPLVP